MSRSSWLSQPPVWVGVICLALLVATALAPQQRYAQGSQKAAAQERGQSGHVLPEVTRRPTDPPPREPKPDRKEWREESDLEAQRDMAQWPLMTMIATWVAAAATGVGVYFVAHTLEATRGMLASSIDAVRAARQANDGTQQSLELIRSNSERELRAYINFSEGSVVNFETGRPTIQAVLTNFGATPAYDVVANVGVRLESLPLAGDLTDAAGQAPQKFGVIGPTAPFTIRISLEDPPLGEEHRNAIKKGSAAIFFFGTITYRDAFAVDRITRFRVAYSASAMADGDGSLVVCPEGNDAD